MRRCGERLPDDLPLNADSPAVDETNFPESFSRGGFHVVGDDVGGLVGAERVEIEEILDGKGDRLVRGIRMHAPSVRN